MPLTFAAHPTYEAALAAATAPAENPQWEDQRWDIPPVSDEQRPVLRPWLMALDTPVVRVDATWGTIKKHWISFLGCSGGLQDPILVPNRARASSEDAERRGMKVYYHTRFSLQGAIWRLLDMREALLERWPDQARKIMNRVTDGEAADPLTSLMGDFAKQRRYNSVWTSLICFLMYCHEDENNLKEMGLYLGPDLRTKLIKIQHAVFEEGFPRSGDDGKSPLTEAAIDTFLLHVLTDANATPKTNPLLWWLTILVRSAIETGPEDYISRGHFSKNILPMDLNIRGRIEAILHFSKVLLLQTAFESSVEYMSVEYIMEVTNQLDAVDNTWIGKHSSHKPERVDSRTCDSPAWKAFLELIADTFEESLGGRVVRLGGRLRCCIKKSGTYKLTWD